MWEETQMKLPYHQRQEPPPPPKYLGQLLSGKITEKELEEFNSCAAQQWNRVTLAQCDHCKRYHITSQTLFLFILQNIYLF